MGGWAWVGDVTSIEGIHGHIKRDETISFSGGGRLAFWSLWGTVVGEGGWVGGWLIEKVEEEQAVGMRCCGLRGGGWVGR